MSGALIAERSHSPTFKVAHLLTIEGVKARIAKREKFTSTPFSSPEEKNKTKFAITLKFGLEKENYLSVYLEPRGKDVFVKELKFSVVDVNFNEKQSLETSDQLFETTGRGFKDFYDLNDFSLLDDTLCLQSEFVFVGETSGGALRQFSSRDASFDVDLLKLSSDGENADVTIVVGEKKFKAHKVLLVARSDYFRALFDSGMEETVNNEVPIEEADPDIF